MRLCMPWSTDSNDMRAPCEHRGKRRLVMCHMIADTRRELMAMVDRIEVSRRWLQSENNHGDHFDICLSKRALAVKAGAIEITWRELSLRCRSRLIAGGECVYFERHPTDEDETL